jgi:SAM-dependent methyltransferase/DNA-binding transcriptional ArsR family regulator
MMLDDLTLLSDATRVRILRLVEREELGVGELVHILQLPQSTVSRHLKALTTSEWIHKRTVGTSSLVWLDSQALTEARRALWSLVRSETSGDLATLQDLQRMSSLLSQRQLDSRAFFGAVGSRWGEVRRDLFGEQFLVPITMALVDPTLIVADLGCGAGDMTAQLAPSVARVIAIDHEAGMLDIASKRLSHFDNVDLHLGELTALPIDDAVVDIALVMLVLHHVTAVEEALHEIRRVLKPNGRLVLLDMTRHDRESYRYRMGHVHLGFEREALETSAAQADLSLERYHLVPADPDARGPGLFVATFRA